MDDLLRSCSWRADKLLRQRGHFGTVLFLAQYADGRRQWFERSCAHAPDTANDAELLADLAQDVGLDFADAEVRVVAFVVAYLGNRVTVIRPIDPNAAMQPKETRRQGVIIELHGDNEQVSMFREIIRLPERAPMLAAPTDEPFIASPYAHVLQLAAKWRPNPRQDAKTA